MHPIFTLLYQNKLDVLLKSKDLDLKEHLFSCGWEIMLATVQLAQLHLI